MNKRLWILFSIALISQWVMLPTLVASDSSPLNSIYIEGARAYADEEVSLVIGMKNEKADYISGFSFFLTVPSGVNPSTIVVKMSGTRANASGFVLDVVQSDKLFVTCYSSSSSAFAGTDGEILTLSFKAPHVSGDYTFSPSDVILASKYGDEIEAGANPADLVVHVLGDVNLSGTIDSVDVKVIADYILGKDSMGLFSIEAADLNNDNCIDVADLIVLLNLLRS